MTERDFVISYLLRHTDGAGLSLGDHAPRLIKAAEEFWVAIQKAYPEAKEKAPTASASKAFGRQYSKAEMGKLER